MKVNLRDFVTGSGILLINGRLDHKGMKKGGVLAAPANKPLESLIKVSFSTSMDSLERWSLFDADLRDASGNAVETASRKLKPDSMRFDPVLWPDEPAWNLRLHLKRVRGFQPDELITFSNVFLPSLNASQGIECQLTEIRRRPPTDPSRGRSGRQLDLVSLTSWPSGDVVRFLPSSWSQTHRVYHLESIQTSDTHVDLVFALQDAKFVEFMVSPTWITNAAGCTIRDP